MKNNEYNIVNVNNEKNNFSYEYTKAQNVEYSFQAENKANIKDELNDNKTVNDKVEDNVSRKTKAKQEKREESEKMSESTSSSSSASSSSASFSSSSASASASSGAAATGSVAGTVVAAATVSVTAIGAAVGISIGITPDQGKDLVQFVSSEITTNSVSFSFSMSSKLLRYDESQQEADKPASEKSVVYTIKNSSGYFEEQILEEYKIVEEDIYLYTASIGGLTPNTSYALTISIKEENAEYEMPTYQELASRVFTTKEEGDPFVEFLNISQTHESISFDFIVDKKLAEYDPEKPAAPTNLRMSIKDNNEYSQETFAVDKYDEKDENNLICHSSFNELSPETEYTVSVHLMSSQGALFLGSFTAVTDVMPEIIHFESVDATKNSVSFSFTVANEDVGFDPETGRTPPIQLSITDNDTFYDETWLQGYEQFDENTLICYGDFTGLTSGVEYTIIVKLSTETELKVLGSTTFKTTSSGFNFYSINVESHNATIRYYVNPDYVGFVEGETQPNVYSEYTDATGAVVATFQASFSLISGVAFNADAVTGLRGDTTYTVTVYFNDDGVIEVLGTTEFTTEPGDSGFAFEEDSFIITEATMRVIFDINANEVTRTGDGSNIDLTISGGIGYSEKANINEFQESVVSGKVFAEYTFEGLQPGITYTVSVSNNATSEVYGSIEKTTLDNRETGFELVNVTPSEQSVEVTFKVSSTYCRETTGLTIAVYTPSGTLVSSNGASLEDESTNTCYAEVTGLTGGTDYVIGYFYEDGQTKELLATSNFTTLENEMGFSFLEDSFAINEISISFSFIVDEDQVNVSGQSSNIHAKIRESSASTDLQDIALTEYYSVSQSGKVGFDVTFDSLSAYTDYFVTISNEEKGLDYSKVCSTTRDPQLSFGQFSAEAEFVSFNFSLSADFIEYDSSNPDATIDNLRCEIRDANESYDAVYGSISNLSLDSDSGLVTGLIEATNLRSRTQYTVKMFRRDGNKFVKFGATAGFTTTAIQPVFYRAVVDQEASFYNHVITLTLDYTDDEEDPTYTDLSIQFYDGNGDALGSHYPLSKVKTKQTLTIPQTQQEGVYDFALGDVASFKIYNVQEELYTDTITFTNSDPKPTFSGLNDNSTDYYATFYAQVIDTTGEIRMPIRCNYVDNYDYYSGRFKVVLESGGAQFETYIDVSNKYQYAVFTDTSLVNYLGNNNFVISIYTENNTLAYSKERVQLVSAASSGSGYNEVYDAEITNTEIEQSGSDVYLNMSFVYVYTNTTGGNVNVKLVNTSDSNEYYTFEVPAIDDTVAINMLSNLVEISPTAEIRDYSQLKEAMDGKTFEVNIYFYNGTETKMITVSNGVTLNFIS